MVKEQKHLSACFARPAPHAMQHCAACIDGNNGFAPVLSASYWKESVNKLFLLILHVSAGAESLLDLVEIIHGNSFPTFPSL